MIKNKINCTKGDENSMSFFIHTFSLQKNAYYKQAKKIWTCYNDMNIKQEDGIIINHFAEEGLRIQISHRSNIAIHYDKEHKDTKIELIITPYKLLHPGNYLGEIRNRREMHDASMRLYELLDEIKSDTGVNLLKGAEIKRIDITKDVITPSQEYTREIIAVCKATSLQRGYYFCNPAKTQCELNGWNPQNACLYKNKSQGIKVKIYDKQQNLIDFRKAVASEETGNGLIRFEISLEKELLKKKGYLIDENYFSILNRVMENASDLFREYFLLIMDQGEMLSFPVLEKYIKCKKGNCSAAKKMLEFSKIYNYFRKNGKEFDREHFPYSYKKFVGLRKKYVDLGLSPIPLSDACPYIPSFQNLFLEDIDMKMYKFAKKHTRGKEVWFDAE